MPPVSMKFWTRVPSPWRIRTSPRCSSFFSASRSDARLTRSRFDSSRSGGSFDPGRVLAVEDQRAQLLGDLLGDTLLLDRLEHPLSAG